MERNIIYGGDHKQLPQFLVSQEALKLWTKTFFEELTDRKWPTTLLDVQYRCHSDAAEAAYRVIYDGQVRAPSGPPGPRAGKEAMPADGCPFLNAGEFSSVLFLGEQLLRLRVRELQRRQQRL